MTKLGDGLERWLESASKTNLAMTVVWISNAKALIRAYEEKIAADADYDWLQEMGKDGVAEAGRRADAADDALVAIKEEIEKDGV